jgi:hypothetical protein
MKQINGLYNLGVGRNTDDRKTEKTQTELEDTETKKD